MRYLLSLVLLLFFSLARAQVLTLSGKVFNEKNEPLPSISVKIMGAGGTSTDIDGRFVLNLSPGKKYELVFTGVGYSSKTISDVELVVGHPNELNILLEVKAGTNENVTVTAKSNSRRETVNSVIAWQRNAPMLASVISAETIRRSPDKNTGEVLKRTPGASLQEGRFIVVRGLADRYNQAMLNGILLTSTEPDRKSFSFDLVPAAMIDNIIINKSFIPEYPGEWAGGLIQVNTRDIPSKNYFNMQLGLGFNTNTTGKTFYRDGEGGKLDWVGTDDGSRALPSGYTTKSGFDQLSPAQKTAIGKKLRHNWLPEQGTAAPNFSLQTNAGFTGKFLGKTVGGSFGLLYNNSRRHYKLLNRVNAVDQHTYAVSVVSDYRDNKYQDEITAGALAAISLQLNPLNKISVRSLLNINSTDAVSERKGVDFSRAEDLEGSEFSFKQNTFFTVQANGDHSIVQPLKLKWYGAFTILDGYIPDQRRILYSKLTGVNEPYRLLISNTLSQQSGSRIFQSLSDYIYTAGGDLNYSFNWFEQKQSVKGGYMIQVKDRLYDAKLFANYLPLDNDVLRQLPADKIFLPSNFGDGSGSLFSFDAIKGNTFRYMANTILNAAFLQADNQLGKKFRVVWGLRIEHYDQLVGSVKASDPRHNHSAVTDFLPGLNATFKLNATTNLRFSASKTVIRPELRELSFLNLYDFELNASVQGNPALERTNISNFDLRYEYYPRAGELLTAGVFYKDFKNPIEQLFNGAGGGASTFTYANARKARSAGIELEFRKKLDFIPATRHFSFQANGAYIKTRVTDSTLDVNRALQGQSPYLLNLGLLYDLEKAGLNATLLFNQVGERIYLVGDAFAGAPDIYEAPRAILDLQFGKKLLNKKAELKLTISDLLNQTQYFYQNANNKKTFQKNTDAWRFSRSYGTTFNLSFNYSL